VDEDAVSNAAADGGGAELSPLLATHGQPGADEEMMSLTVLHDGGAVIVAVTGEIDLATAASLRDALTAELAAGPDVLIVDLDGVEFFTSVGLTTLALTQRAAQERGVALRVIATSRATLRPLRITGMADDLALYGSRADALAERPLQVAGALPADLTN
jgi:anti-sigma B factor antagonist